MTFGPSPFSVEFATGRAQSGTLRFSCKEMFDVAGHPATCGHPRYPGSRAVGATSAIVEHLLKRGAQLVGKTLQSELAISGAGDNPHHAMPLNPRHPDRVPGGSSTGCAVAVATGRVDFSLATDTAGSARIPAACCEVFGLALAGQERWLADAVRLSPTLDQLGLIAPNVRTSRRAIDAIGIPAVPRVPRRVLVPTGLLNRCAADVVEDFTRAATALEQHGVAVATTNTRAFAETEEVQAQHGSLALAEIAASLEVFLAEREDDVSPAILQRLEPYRGWPPSRVLRVKRLTLRPLRRFRAGHPEPLLLPTLPVAPPPLGSPAALGSITKFSNLLGESSVSVPPPSHKASLMLVGAQVGELVGFAGLCERLGLVARGPHEGASEPSPSRGNELD